MDSSATIGHSALVPGAKRSIQKSFVLDGDWLATPVIVHPRWHGTYFELSQPNAADADPVIVNLIPSEVRRYGRKTLPAAIQTVTPYVAVNQPFLAPNGWIEPWSIQYGADWLSSFRLPPWLLPAPTQSSPSVPVALGRCEGTIEPWPPYDPLSSPLTLDGIRSLDATVSVDAAVYWWKQDRFDGITRYKSADSLMDALTSDLRPHLIRGLFDDQSFPLWI